MLQKIFYDLFTYLFIFIHFSINLPHFTFYPFSIRFITIIFFFHSSYYYYSFLLILYSYFNWPSPFSFSSPPPRFTFSFPLLLVYVHLREAIPLFDYISASNTSLENQGRWGSERTNERDTLIGGQHFVFHDDNCSANWESMIRNSLFSNVLPRYTSLFLDRSFSHFYQFVTINFSKVFVSLIYHPLIISI